MCDIHIGTRWLLAKLSMLALVIAAAGCGQPLATTPSARQPITAASAAPAPTARPSTPPSATMAPTPAPLPSATPTPDPANDPVFVGAGDIAACGSDGAETTARLLDRIEGTVFTLGDNAYEFGTAAEFRDCYDPTWGRHKARTRPSPGNHDYVTPGAAAYYDYFGESAGPERRGYYSFDLGAWHIVSLNSEIDAGPKSAQVQWLATDLAAHPAACTLAYWHKPIFSSGSVHGNDPHMRPIWDILARAGADVVLNGHDHIYERFAPQTTDGVADPQGMREFIAGVGGAELYGLGAIQPNSEVRGTGVFGVLKLTLHTASYDWEFVPADAGAFSDAGSAGCVGVAPR
jgi:calcineurin-like phosphoesterase family protein